MTEALEAYRQLEIRLHRVRLDNDNQESPEEDEILEQMDLVWYDITPEEREMLQNEGPSCW
jgi:hypothetical protein